MAKKPSKAITSDLNQLRNVLHSSFVNSVIFISAALAAKIFCACAVRPFSEFKIALISITLKFKYLFCYLFISECKINAFILINQTKSGKSLVLYLNLTFI